MKDLVKFIARTALSSIFWAFKIKLNEHNVQSTQVAWFANIGKHVVIRAGTEIGPNVTIGDYSYISSPRSYVESATIGKFCSIALQTIIGVSGHDYTKVTTYPIVIDPFYKFIDKPLSEIQKPQPTIGNDVWIGINIIIHRGVNIGMVL